MAERPSITFAYPDREHEALQPALEQAALRVLRSGSYVLGPEVQAFERAFAAYTGSLHAVAVSSGTDALVCSLVALGVGAGHEVIVPAFGFVAAAEAVVRAGADPVFVDIEPHTLGPDPEGCARVRSDRTRAVIVMHLFGQAVDLAPVRAATGGVPVIEDAAQAIGTRLEGRQVGTLDQVGTFSFFPAKSLGAAGDAGAVVTPDAGIAERVRRARAHGASRPYLWDGPGGNYRMDALQAALLAVKLEAIEPRLLRRRAVGRRLADVAMQHGSRVIDGTPGCEPTYAPFALRVPQRDRVLQGLRDRGVDARVHYPVTLVDAPVFAAARRSGPFPEAERATRELVSLPCSSELTEPEVERLVRALDEVLRG